MENNTRKKSALAEKAGLLTGGGQWTSAACDGLGIPSVRFSDGPTGLRMQGGKGDHLGRNKSYPATCFPTHSALACSWNKELAAKVGESIGEEANACGVDVLLAPGLNIKRNPLCGRNFEYFSEDAYLNGKLGAAYVSGVQTAGAGACIKHFAVNNRESGRMVCDSVVDERTLRELYLTAFEIAVKEGKPSAVMTAYNKLNGIYCNENTFLIEGILRGEWGFDGLVISDWGGTHDRAAAVRAGADLEMPPCKFSEGEVESAVISGSLSESEVDECIGRIKKLALRKKENADCDFESHADFANKCAEECAVLLKNDGVLPLSGNGKTVLIGDMAERPVIQGGGSSKVNPRAAQSLLCCLKDNISGFARGYAPRGKNGKLKKRALKLCKSADTVIFCAGLYDGDCEGADRQNLFLPENQIELLNEITALNKRVAVVLFCGSAVDTGWDERVNAVLYAGLGGQAAAGAVANILTGKTCPSGKLAETFPLTQDSVPSDKYFNESPYYTVYGEGTDVGYRYFYNKPVAYPFGHGLSYTSFEYENLNIGENGVSVTVTNTGKVSGGEVVQAYIRFPDGANSPPLQLKGFEKIFLGAGESKKVFIPFDEYTFRSFDVKSGRWVQVKGEYEILIGSSSADVRLSGKIEREGVEGVAPPQTQELKPCLHTLNKNKKGRVIADIHTPLCELKNARGWFGRLFTRLTLYAVRNNRTVYGSMEYLPLRTMAQFGKMKKSTADGLILMFNGYFFKGLIKIIKG